MVSLHQLVLSSPQFTVHVTLLQVSLLSSPQFTARSQFYYGRIPQFYVLFATNRPWICGLMSYALPRRPD